MLQLRTRVDQEVARLGADRAMLRRCVLSILGRANSVIAANGGFIED